MKSGKVQVKMQVYDLTITCIECYQHTHALDEHLTGKILPDADWANHHITSCDSQQLMADLNITTPDHFSVLMTVDIEGNDQDLDDYDEKLTIHDFSVQKIDGVPPRNLFFEINDQ